MNTGTPSRRQILAIAPVSLLTAAAAPNVQTGGADGDISFAAGVHRIEADMSVSGQLTLAPGAQLWIGAGVTLRLRGDLSAPAAHIFLGPGRVDMLHGRVLAARPEWWGAAADDPAVDCRAAFAACLEAHLVMVLGTGDYYLAQTWVIDRSNRRIWGIGRAKDARGTRLLLRGGSGTVVQVGSETAPASINNYITGVDLRWVELGRTAAPGISGAAPATGLAIRHVLDCQFEGLRANEHAICYSIQGAVRTYLRDCRAFRSLAHDPAGQDIFIGFDMDGFRPSIPTGANASVYLVDCNATLGAAPRLKTSIGARLLGAMSDSFLTRFETSAVGTGILVDGGSEAPDKIDRRFSQVDVHIDTPVLDQCGSSGIEISRLAANAMLEIRSPYVAIAQAGTVALRCAQLGGSVSVSGGQLIGSFAPNMIGVELEQVTGVAISGTTLLGCARPIEVRGGTALDLVFAVIGDATGHGPAITVERSRQIYMRPRLSGISGAYGSGIAIDAASRAITIETVGIDGSKLAANGATLTIAGRSPRSDGSTTLFTIASAP